jgi:hypothetical protein
MLSKKGDELIRLYKTMADEGDMRDSGVKVNDAFSDFESRYYRDHINSAFMEIGVKTVLDYGCGGSDWNMKGFDTSGKSAKEFYRLEEVNRYEPARNIDERKVSDAVLNFDVLEHIFIADVQSVLKDIFSYASKLVVINVACYPAAALLPNGENAHVTVRHPFWWKSQLDNMALEFPEISILLLASTEYKKSMSFPIYKASDWIDSDKFVTE